LIGKAFAVLGPTKGMGLGVEPFGVLEIVRNAFRVLFVGAVVAVTEEGCGASLQVIFADLAPQWGAFGNIELPPDFNFHTHYACAALPLRDFCTRTGIDFAAGTLLSSA
jgi:hypothetical protein